MFGWMSGRREKCLLELTAFVYRCSNSKDKFQCLQTADINTLSAVNFNATAMTFFGNVIALPVIDGEFIVEHPVVTLDKGLVNAVRRFSFHFAQSSHNH